MAMHVRLLHVSFRDPVCIRAQPANWVILNTYNHPNVLLRCAKLADPIWCYRTHYDRIVCSRAKSGRSDIHTYIALYIHHIRSMHIARRIKRPPRATAQPWQKQRSISKKECRQRSLLCGEHNNIDSATTTHHNLAGGTLAGAGWL